MGWSWSNLQKLASPPNDSPVAESAPPPPDVYITPPIVMEDFADSGLGAPVETLTPQPSPTFPAVVKPQEGIPLANTNPQWFGLGSSAELRNVFDPGIVPPSPPKTSLTSPAPIQNDVAGPNLSILDKLRGLKDRLLDPITEPLKAGKTYRLIVNRPADMDKVTKLRGRSIVFMGVTIKITDTGEWGPDSAFIMIRTGSVPKGA